VPLSIIYNPPDLNVGEIKLEATAAGTKIRVWTNATKGTQVTLPEIWDLSSEQPPSTSYVEGYATSDAVRDVTVRLSYSVGGQTNAQDELKVTVTHVDLSATDLYGAVTEANEENPGAYVHDNVDNDNGNTSLGLPIADRDETDPITGENDLKSAAITLEPSSLAVGQVVLKRSSEKARVWTDPEKAWGSILLLFVDQKVWDLSDEAQRTEFNDVKSNLWVEGYLDNSTPCDLTVEYHDPYGRLVWSDVVKYTFIAAVCGDQPTPAQRSGFETDFPNLIHCEWSITGPETSAYNCIAWSVDETSVWYYPLDIDQDFGDGDEWFEDSDMDAFYDDKKSWSLIATGTDEEKAGQAEAMYYPYSSAWHYTVDPPPATGYHAARKKSCSCGAGKWIMYESKCGATNRLEHVWNQLNGSVYGSPGRFYE
jgi:hypothetical protein